MRTLILGTGIIGAIYGWALAESGVDVTHYLGPSYSSCPRIVRCGIDFGIPTEKWIQFFYEFADQYLVKPSYARRKEYVHLSQKYHLSSS
jgi:hypothetical protein